MTRPETHRVDVLSLEWTTTPSRDRVMATLVNNYLRLRGLHVVEGSVHDGLHLLHCLRPRLFFICNSVGALENLDAMRYAKRRGIPALSLISEGAFMGDDNYLLQLVWGWNKERVLHEDLQLQWSNFTRGITLRLHPELAGRIKVSGGVGFDNYKIAPGGNVRADLLRKYGKESYRKVVGLGCWNFGIFHSADTRYSINIGLYGEAAAARFRSDGEQFDEVLAALVRSRPDILFLLKEHPGTELGREGSGIAKASREPNVLVLKFEEPIYNCIQASDIWMVYESTTAMEAWLLDKPTLLLNPSGRDFPRDRLSEGSPDFASASALADALDAFYATGEIPAFASRRLRRRQLIEEYIQWDDGLNHVRAGNEILQLLAGLGDSRWRPESLAERHLRWLQHFKWVAGPLLRRSKAFRESYANRHNFSQEKLTRYNLGKMAEQKDYYHRMGLAPQDLAKIRCI